MTIYRSINALAQSVIGLYKAGLVRRAGPWRCLEQLELATAGWVHWWNTSRLHSACDGIPPFEYEAAYWRRQQAAAVAA